MGKNRRLVRDNRINRKNRINMNQIKIVMCMLMMLIFGSAMGAQCGEVCGATKNTDECEVCCGSLGPLSCPKAHWSNNHCTCSTL